MRSIIIPLIKRELLLLWHEYVAVGAGVCAALVPVAIIGTLVLALILRGMILSAVFFYIVALVLGFIYMDIVYRRVRRWWQ